MPEIVFSGEEGRLEGRYSNGTTPDAPGALILHHSAQMGGNMNTTIPYNLYYLFQRHGFSVLRFNFRGVGRSQGNFDNGPGELCDAASALDWLQASNRNASRFWVVGFAFGAWIGMQLLMRRPEIKGFVAITPPANFYDFSFLAPCPASGLMINGGKDKIVPCEKIIELHHQLKTQKGAHVEHDMIKGANHLYTGYLPELIARVEEYLDKQNPGIGF